MVMTLIDVGEIWQQDDRLRGLLAADISHVANWWQQAGVLEWSGWTELPSRYGDAPTCVGGALSLTAFGRHVMPGWLDEVGYDAPVIADPASLPIDEMVAIVSLADEEDIEGLFSLWRPTWTPAQRAEALVDLIESSLTPIQRLRPIQLLDTVDVDAAESAVRRLLGGRWGSYGLMWLVQNGRATDDDGAWFDLMPVIDLMAHEMVDPAAPDSLIAAFDLAAQRQAAGLLDGLWRHDHPDLADALDILGRAHPDNRS